MYIYIYISPNLLYRNSTTEYISLNYFYRVQLLYNCLKNHLITKNPCFIARIYLLAHEHFSRGSSFDENLANIFNKVDCLTYKVLHS